VNAPFGGIHKPIIADQRDYEVELVAVIGKKGRRISVERAPEYVFGAPSYRHPPRLDPVFDLQPGIASGAWRTQGSFGQTPKRSRNLCEADPSLNLRVAA
jgi:Fumarylacetoacetate (FAA) hydrolase family